MVKGKFCWIIGDNFDHNKITLTGHDTIHNMAVMMTQTPSTTSLHRITRYERNFAKNKPLPMIESKDS